MKFTGKGIGGIVCIGIGVIGGLGMYNGKLVDRLLGTCTLILIGAFLVWSDRKYLSTPPSVLWRKWDASASSAAQQKRMERAAYNQLTVQNIDYARMRGTFVGSKGGNYKTTLLKCTCPDFKKRGVPCKHMYKLADELGVFSSSAEQV